MSDQPEEISDQVREVLQAVKEGKYASSIEMHRKFHSMILNVRREFPKEKKVPKEVIEFLDGLTYAELVLSAMEGVPILHPAFNNAFFTRRDNRNYDAQAAVILEIVTRPMLFDVIKQPWCFDWHGQYAGDLVTPDDWDNLVDMESGLTEYSRELERKERRVYTMEAKYIHEREAYDEEVRKWMMDKWRMHDNVDYKGLTYRYVMRQLNLTEPRGPRGVLPNR